VRIRRFGSAQHATKAQRRQHTTASWSALLPQLPRRRDAASSPEPRGPDHGPVPRNEHRSGAPLERSVAARRLSLASTGDTTRCSTLPPARPLSLALSLSRARCSLGPQAWPPFQLKPCVRLQWMSQVNTSLADSDPEIYDIVEREKHRQVSGKPAHLVAARCMPELRPNT
jgi:hypothetical protein